jgi:DNA-binding SARP family transcriptional activator
MLRIRVLGELELELDGERIEPPRRGPARNLLAWLALHPGPHPRSAVAGRLWPNVLDASARASLRTSLSALRATIGGAALATGRTHVGLADRHVWVDAHEFDRLRATGRAEDALGLCRGELLTGLDEDWVLVARDEHRDARGQLLAALAEDAAERGKPETAVALARRRTTLDPLDEAAHRDLMVRLVQAGDRAGALAYNERFAERLRRQLGVAPSPATRQLASALRAGSLADGYRTTKKPRREPPPLPARLVAARRRGTLVGREAELARLHGVWERAVRDGPLLVLVTGEPGIGKTRLLAELASERSDTVVLYGREEEEALIPYQPLVECLRDAIRSPVALPEEANELAGLLPELAEQAPPHATAVGVEPSPGARTRMFAAIAAVLDASAEGRPLLLVLDDLHWADRPTVQLLAHLALRPAAAQRLIVASYRDTDLRPGHPLPAVLADLGRELPVERIALAGLSPDAVAAMLARAHAAGSDPGAAQDLHARTGGNPFYIEQLLQNAGTPAGGIAELVTRRVSALGPQAQAILETAALAGPEFELSIVAEATGTVLDEALDAFDAAVRARLVAELPDEPGRSAFVHDIVRETLTGSLTAARRTRVHELVAGALERRAEQDPDRYLAQLAAHALEAAAGGGDPVHAADLAERAARRAGAVLAHEDAANLLQRALAALERRGAPAGRRGELACSIGEALARTGLREDAQAAFAKARALARTSDRADLLARAALGAGGAGVTILGPHPNTIAELEQALDALGADDPALRARLLARLAIELAYEQDPSRREAASDEALALARRAGDPAALAAALNARHVALWGPEHTERRLELASEMLDLARRADNNELALQARNWRVVDLFELGDGPAVRDEIDAYAAVSTDARLPGYAWYVPLWRATLALLDGRIAEGMDLTRRAHALGRQAGDANADVFFAEHQLLRLLVQDRIADVDPVAMGVEDIVSERAEHGPAWQAYRLTFAWAHAERGDLDEARCHYDAALADGLASIPRDVNWLAALASAAIACVLLGDTECARELRALLDPYSHRMVVTARGACHVGSVAYLLARLAAAGGDYDTAARLYEDAANRDERAGATAFVRRDRRARDALAHHAHLRSE